MTTLKSLSQFQHLCYLGIGVGWSIFLIEVMIFLDIGISDFYCILEIWGIILWDFGSYWIFWFSRSLLILCSRERNTALLLIVGMEGGSSIVGPGWKSKLPTSTSQTLPLRKKRGASSQLCEGRSLGSPLGTQSLVIGVGVGLQFFFCGFG